MQVQKEKERSVTSICAIAEFLHRGQIIYNTTQFNVWTVKMNKPI